jgi:hypothetical protein
MMNEEDDDSVDDDNIMSKSAIPEFATSGSFAQITILLGLFW